jgi:ATP-binding cassette subfamily B protein
LVAGRGTRRHGESGTPGYGGGERGNGMSGGGAAVALDARAPAAAAPPPSGSLWARLSLLLGERRRAVAVLVLASIVAGFAEAVLLAILAETAATLAKGAKSAHIALGPLHLHASAGALIGAAFVVVVVRLALQIPMSILPPRIAADAQARLRRRLFNAFSRASWDVQARDREGQLQETMTGQAMQATGAVLNAMGLIGATLNTLVLLAFAIALNVVAAVIVLAAAVAMFAMLRPLRRLGARRARALSASQVQYAGGIAESIRVAEETQVFGAGEAQRARIEGFITTTRGHMLVTQTLLRLVSSVYAALIYVMFVGALFGLYEAGRGHAAALGAIVLILVRAASSGQNVQTAYQGLLQSMPFVEYTLEAERRYTESIPIAGTQALPDIATLGFDHVSYAYRAGQPVLADVTFEVNGGEVVGVIGPSGAGKSTLVSLLLRLRLPQEGSYLVNGVPAEQFAQEDWHKRVAYVPQEPRLLHASVADNIRYFRDLDDAAVERAARLARIHEEIVTWPEGYDTIVGPRADAVSGGQQQRICLARALVDQPEMLVLDEPTSALDPKSEALIQESLTSLKQKLTLFIVAHRMSTLNICDRVMVIIDGGLTAFDTIAALQQDNAYYRSAAKITAAAPVGSRGAEHAAGAARVVATAGIAGPSDGGDVSTAATDVPQGRVPDFFIVGHPKSGTTALYEALRAHPQIYMPDGKEPWFFAPELHERTPPRPEGTPSTLDDYLALFTAARPEQRVGEATALYLWSQTAARRIAQVQPNARIIAILREPASFLRSLHLQFLQTYVETESDLRSALELEDARRQGRQMPRYTYWPQALLYSEHVRYVEQLRRYHAAFAPENVLVLIYDDFRADNDGTLRTVLRFLDVEQTAAIEVPQANPTVRARSQRLHELMHALSVGRGPVSVAVKETVKALTPQGLRRQALYAAQRHVVFADPGAADEQLMSELRDRYRGEVEALSEYLGRDLVTLWGYDSVTQG